MTWIKGQSGNPEGRRLGKPITDAIGMELAMIADGRKDDPVPARSLRAAIRKQLERASKGDLASLQFLAERIEGKPRVHIAGDDELPIQVQVTRGEDAARRITEQLGRIAAREVENAVADDSEQQ